MSDQTTLMLRVPTVHADIGRDSIRDLICQGERRGNGSLDMGKARALEHAAWALARFSELGAEVLVDKNDGTHASTLANEVEALRRLRNELKESQSEKFKAWKLRDNAESAYAQLSHWVTMTAREIPGVEMPEGPALGSAQIRIQELVNQLPPEGERRRSAPEFEAWAVRQAERMLNSNVEVDIYHAVRTIEAAAEAAAEGVKQIRLSDRELTPDAALEAVLKRLKGAPCADDDGLIGSIVALGARIARSEGHGRVVTREESLTAAISHLTHSDSYQDIVGCAPGLLKTIFDNFKAKHGLEKYHTIHDLLSLVGYDVDITDKSARIEREARGDITDLKGSGNADCTAVDIEGWTEESTQEAISAQSENMRLNSESALILEGGAAGRKFIAGPALVRQIVDQVKDAVAEDRFVRVKMKKPGNQRECVSLSGCDLRKARYTLWALRCVAQGKTPGGNATIGEIVQGYVEVLHGLLNAEEE